MIFEYLLFNCVVAVGPLLVWKFYPGMVKLRRRAAVMAVGLSAALFVAWDMAVTGYFWTFNQRYTLGWSVLTVPLEEILFFITVPSACLLLYVNFVNRFGRKREMGRGWMTLLTIVSVLMGTFFLVGGKYYTSVVLFLLGAVWWFDFWLNKGKVVVKHTYWQFMGIVLILTLVFNYYLTSRPIVLYNDALTTQLRVLTIPIEDLGYSLALLSLVLTLYEYAALRDT